MWIDEYAKRGMEQLVSAVEVGAELALMVQSDGKELFEPVMFGSDMVGIYLLSDECPMRLYIEFARTGRKTKDGFAIFKEVED